MVYKVESNLIFCFLTNFLERLILHKMRKWRRQNSSIFIAFCKYHFEISEIVFLYCDESIVRYPYLILIVHRKKFQNWYDALIRLNLLIVNCYYVPFQNVYKNYNFCLLPTPVFM